MPDNFERMVKLAEEFFGMKADPRQLQVDASVIARLREIHPATLTEERDENGPIAWMLVVPTTLATMERFLARECEERDLLAADRPGEPLEALYLCSALVLPEFRRRGLARRLAVKAVRALSRDLPISCLYCWTFSPEGEALARVVAGESGLPVRMRPPAEGGPHTHG